MTLDIGDYDIETQFYAILFLIIMFGSCLISTYFGLLALKYLLCKRFGRQSEQTSPKKKKLHWFLRYTSLASIVSFCICNVVQFAALLLYMIGMDFLVPWTTGDSYI